MTITPESVAKLLSSEDYGDRLKGLNQLRQVEEAIAFEMIQPLIVDNNVRIRYAAASQMAILGQQDLQKSLQILRDRLFNDPETDVKAAAADALGALKLTEAFSDLEQVYQTTEEWLLKLSIVATLGEMGDPRGFDILADAINSETDIVKTAAISSLGELGDSRGVTLLSPFATNSDWQVRYRVVLALNRLGGPEARSILESLAQDEVEQVATEAKKGLEST
ncbi:MAG: HEAT repeat domain-containing protein [Hormoscilla sp. GM7CHS1pb]|nr:HEAT repeat domain-containing protein [Hormoscilla sp. GM7CHS1pb]